MNPNQETGAVLKASAAPPDPDFDLDIRVQPKPNRAISSGGETATSIIISLLFCDDLTIYTCANRCGTNDTCGTNCTCGCTGCSACAQGTTENG